MSYIVTPSRRTKQPQNFSRLNRRFESGGGTLLWNAALPEINCANGRALNLSNATNSSAPRGTFSGGRSWRFTESGGAARYIEGTLAAGSTAGATAIIQIYGPLYGDSGFISCGVVGLNGVAFSRNKNDYWGLADAPMGAAITSQGYGTHVFSTTGPAPVTTVVTAVASITPTRACLSFNGSAAEILTNSFGYVPWADGASVKFGSTSPDGYNIFYGYYSLVALLPYPVADADVISLSAHAWQIFATDHRVLYFSGAGAGGTGDSVAASSGSSDAIALAASLGASQGASITTATSGSMAVVAAASTAASIAAVVGVAVGSGAATACSASVGSAAGAGAATGLSASIGTAIGTNAAAAASASVGASAGTSSAAAYSSSASIATGAGISVATAMTGAIGWSAGTSTAAGYSSAASIAAAASSSAGLAIAGFIATATAQASAISVSGAVALAAGASVGAAVGEAVNATVAASGGESLAQAIAGALGLAMGASAASGVSSMPGTLLHPAMARIRARQPASVDVRASILAGDCTN